MNTTAAKPEGPDELDRLLSDFFKAQLKHPWPNAPIPPGSAGAARPATEPSELVAARTARAPRSAPAQKRPATGHDNTARARFTLAASVALMLGACWYLSNGFESGTRVMPNISQPGTNMLPGSDADGNKLDALKTIEENKTKDAAGPKIDMGKFE